MNHGLSCTKKESSPQFQTEKVSDTKENQKSPKKTTNDEDMSNEDKKESRSTNQEEESDERASSRTNVVQEEEEEVKEWNEQYPFLQQIRSLLRSSNNNTIHSNGNMLTIRCMNETDQQLALLDDDTIVWTFIYIDIH